MRKWTDNIHGTYVAPIGRARALTRSFKEDMVAIHVELCPEQSYKESKSRRPYRYPSGFLVQNSVALLAYIKEALEYLLAYPDTSHKWTISRMPKALFAS